MNILSFQKPSRYINTEKNSIHKEAPLAVALAFPDIYDVGMSHLGLKILYSIINSLPFAVAERVFSPWTDLEKGMRSSQIRLSSLESGRQLKDFDVLGFSLQYELSYPTVLNMLDLGGIPVMSDERLCREDLPLVIAGGPCAVNPLPMSSFIDAFLIGDGEDAITEILAVCHSWKKSGLKDKGRLLEELAGIDGIFAPSVSRGKRVRRRAIASLDDAPFPDAPVVPFTGIIHDRVNIEIARGCSAGCRFCQAGMIYRPVRERSPETVISLAERSLGNTGYDSLSFTSLSAGDHSCLLSIMHECNRRFSPKRIAISLPSLRVGSVNRSMLRELRTVRKTGFTIAPEAGTDRLRSVINKDFTGQMYQEALEALFTEGWQNLKLYFMTGLPTETDEDIEAIPEMVLKAIRTCKKLTGRHLNISVGVSSFVPKPHTPFQWYGQNALGTLKEKNGFLRKALLRRGIQFRGHDEDMSLLEAAISRGDERTGALIKKAWELGCRLDAWTEAFDFSRWRQAMDLTGIDASEYAERAYQADEVLPWDVIDTGVSRDYLREEYEKANAGRFTEDCRKECQVCGLQCAPLEHGVSSLPAPAASVSAGAQRCLDTAAVSIRIRLRYSKTEKARFLSHLELTTALIRAMRRAEFPFRYSSGFHPAPKVSFGPALGVGIAGTKEYLDLELIPPFNADQALTRLNMTLPDGIRADRMAAMSGREKSLNSFIVRYEYEVGKAGTNSAEHFMDRESIIVQRKDNSVNIRNMVEGLVRTERGTFLLTLCDLGETRVRLDEILPEIFGARAEELDVTRTSMYGWDGQWKEPFEDKTEWAAKS